MRKLLILFFLLTFTSWANAQDVYVSANISRSISTSENMRPIDIFYGYPGINFSIGNNFNRYWGVRASAGFNPQSGYPAKLIRETFPSISRYHFLTVSGYADVMVNLTELFLEKDLYRTDALYLVLGGGAIRTGKFSSKVHEKEYEHYYPVYTAGRWFGVGRVGLAASLKLTNSLDLGLEGKYNFVSDEYNGVKHGGKLDGFVDINVGINWFFSRRHLQRKDVTKLPIEVMASPREEKFEEGTRMKDGVSFYFDFSDVNSKQWPYVKNVAKFLKSNPSARLIIHGYADKEYTDEENIARNKKLAKNRAQNVCDRLVDVHGIDASRLSVVAHEKPINSYKQVGEWIRAVEFEMTK